VEKSIINKTQRTIILVACRVMEPELNAAMVQTGKKYPVVWMESGLHDRPKVLTKVLQETLDRAEKEYNPDTVLLGYGFCGNAMAGICSGEYRLILPRIDDCITMMIGSRNRKSQLENGVGTMFLTRGWLDRDVDIIDQRRQFIEDYGEEDGIDIFNMMYGNYRRIGLLNCHCYPLEDQIEKTKTLAQELGFEHCVYDGSIDYIRELLTGPWPAERFLVKQPHETIQIKELQI